MGSTLIGSALATDRLVTFRDPRAAARCEIEMNRPTRERHTHAILRSGPGSSIRLSEPDGFFSFVGLWTAPRSP